MTRETVLEHRYRRLLRLYPRSWRSRREEEAVSTFLDASLVDQRVLMPGDVGDVVAGAARHRLRLSAAAGLSAGAGIAAEFALTSAAVLGTIWLCRVEISPEAVDRVVLGGTAMPFQTFGIVLWTVWTVVGLASPLLTPQRMRTAVRVALGLTVLLVPAAAVLSDFAVPLYILGTQTLLGLTALATGRRRHVLFRFAPAAGVVIVGAAALQGRNWEQIGYHVESALKGHLPIVGGALLAAGVVCAVVSGLRRSPAGVWTLLVLLPAVASTAYPWLRSDRNTDMTDEWMVWATVGTAVVATALVTIVTAIGVQNRWHERKAS